MSKFGFLVPTRGLVMGDVSSSGTEMLQLSKLAEELGFSSLWVGDSVMARPRYEPLTSLAGIAAVTNSVEVGTAIYLPLLRNPINVAHQTATVDAISEGRFNFGIGVGGGGSAVEHEYDSLNGSYESRGRAMNEFLDILTKLWTGNRVSYEGEHYQCKDASIGFGPIEKPSIYIPTGSFDSGSGFPSTISKRIIEFGDGCIPNVMHPDEYAASVAELHRLLRSGNRNPTTFDQGLYLDVAIKDNTEAGMKFAREFYDNYYGQGVISEEQISTRCVFGSIWEIQQRLKQFESVGVETFIIRFATPNQKKQLRKFSKIL